MSSKTRGTCTAEDRTRQTLKKHLEPDSAWEGRVPALDLRDGPGQRLPMPYGQVEAGGWGGGFAVLFPPS